MNTKRPININPLSIRLPITALASISHRISGVVVFLSIPYLLYALSLSLSSKQNFTALQSLWTSPLHKMLLWVIAVGFFFHLLAGVRHLIMDLHFGESLRGGRIGAATVFIVSIIFAVWAAVKIGGLS